MKTRNPLDHPELDDPDEQECKIIILRTINQAIKDYEFYKDKKGEEEEEIFWTAKGFLFEDSYMIFWGDYLVNLRVLCDYADINVDWVRNLIVKKLDLKFNIDGTLVPDRTY